MIMLRRIQGEGRGGSTPPPPPLRSFQTCLATHVSCLSLFHTKNNIMSYNISSSPIDHDKKTVATSFLDSLIINSCQMQDRFLTKIAMPARHFSWTMKSACCSGRKTIHFPNPLEMRYLDGKHSGCQ